MTFILDLLTSQTNALRSSATM